MDFVTFMTTCRKFGFSLLNVFHKTVISSPRWRDILSPAQIFCIFPSAIDLVINHLVKFADQTKNKHNSQQQQWLTNLVRSPGKKTGYTSFCLDKRPHFSGAARYCSQVENPWEQLFYLNSSTSDKLFNTFVSKKTDNKEVIEFTIVKQIGVTDLGYQYELKGNNCESDARLHEDSKKRG